MSSTRFTLATLMFVMPNPKRVSLSLEKEETNAKEAKEICFKEKTHQYSHFHPKNVNHGHTQHSIQQPSQRQYGKRR